MTLWVLPSIDRAWREACLSSLAPHLRERVLVVDNSVMNRGVATSWNLGIDRMLSEGHEWLILLSESMRFGAKGGTDFVDQLSGAWCDSLWGWHLIAFHRTTIETVGRFDPGFHPAYFEDTDYLYRMGLAGLPSPRENGRRGPLLIDVDAGDMGTEHGIRSGLVRIDLTKCAAYYERKWGGPQGEEKYRTPFDDPSLDWTWVAKRPWNE